MLDSVDCLGLGIAPVDILMQIDKFPKPGAKIDALQTVIQGGGPIPTAMVTIARLGFKPALITKIGKDVFGDFVIAELKKEKVDTSFIIRTSQMTPIAPGWIEKENGRRTIALGREGGMKSSDIKLSKLPRTKFLHLDGRDMQACLKLARWGRKNNIPIIVDIGSIRNDVSDLIPFADHLVCAEDFALPYTRTRSPRKAIEKLTSLCSGTIVVTSGLKGSAGYGENCKLIRQKAFRIKAVDTTGAGDTYHGGYIAGLLNGWDLPARLQLASAVAAIKCTKMGGRTAIPSMKQALAFIRKKGGKI